MIMKQSRRDLKEGILNTGYLTYSYLYRISGHSRGVTIHLKFESVCDSICTRVDMVVEQGYGKY